LSIELLPAEKGHGTKQNHQVEIETCEVKSNGKARTQENNVPVHLWDYRSTYIVEIQSLLARGTNNRPGVEKVIGQTANISKWLDFDFMIVFGIEIRPKQTCVTIKHKLAHGLELCIMSKVI
jgi:hypothetical protein